MWLGEHEFFVTNFTNIDTMLIMNVCQMTKEKGTLLSSPHHTIGAMPERNSPLLVLVIFFLQLAFLPFPNIYSYR